MCAGKLDGQLFQHFIGSVERSMGGLSRRSVEDVSIRPTRVCWCLAALRFAADKGRDQDCHGEVWLRRLSSIGATWGKVDISDVAAWLTRACIADNHRQLVDDNIVVAAIPWPAPKVASTL